MYDPFKRDPKKYKLQNALNVMSDTGLLQIQLFPA